MSGVEGYVESAASGCSPASTRRRSRRGESRASPPRTTAIGALAYYVSHANPAHYQPSNITFGIMEPLANPPRDKAAKKSRIAERALADLQDWLGAPALGAR